METVRRSQRLMEKDEKDRLSKFPDEILLHIMSFMMIADIVKTSTLSKRWRNLWKFVPDLILHSCDFREDPYFFYEFVSGFVKRRTGDHPLHTLVLKNCYHHFRPARALTNLLLHAVSNNIKHLKLIKIPCYLSFPDSLFSCRTLVSLHITVNPFHVNNHLVFPMVINLPALVSLHLDRIRIRVDEINDGDAALFWDCNKLETLYIKNCSVYYPFAIFSQKELRLALKITNPTLTNLTIIHDIPHPKLKYVISTPKLTSFNLNGSPLHQISRYEEKDLTVEFLSSSLQ